MPYFETVTLKYKPDLLTNPEKYNLNEETVLHIKRMLGGADCAINVAFKPPDDGKYYRDDDALYGYVEEKKRIQLLDF